MKSIKVSEVRDTSVVIKNVVCLEDPEGFQSLQRQTCKSGIISLPSNLNKRTRFIKSWANNNKLSMAVLILPLAACGGGDGSDGVSTPLSGFVIDDYLVGATIFRDTNKNDSFDPGETTTTSNSNGSFTIAGDTSISLVVTGGVDINTGKAFLGVLKAPSDASVITPLTTLVQIMVDDGATLAAAISNVEAAFNLTGNDIMNVDPIASENLELLKVGVQVANLMEAVGSSENALKIAKTLAKTISDNPETNVTDYLTESANINTLLSATGENSISLANASAAVNVLAAQNTSVANIQLTAGSTFADVRTETSSNQNELPSYLSLADVKLYLSNFDSSSVPTMNVSLAAEGSVSASVANEWDALTNGVVTATILDTSISALDSLSESTGNAYAITVTDTSITAAKLLNLDNKTTVAVDASAATQLSGTVSDSKAVVQAAGLSTSSVLSVALTDASENLAADLSAVASAAGAIDASQLTSVTGSHSEVEALLVDASIVGLGSTNLTLTSGAGSQAGSITIAEANKISVLTSGTVTAAISEGQLTALEGLSGTGNAFTISITDTTSVSAPALTTLVPGITDPRNVV